MLIIGCDYHPSVQQIALVDTETGDYGEYRLKHSNGEADKFYRDLKLRGVSVRVGLEATGHTRWFERLLTELGYELMFEKADRLPGADANIRPIRFCTQSMRKLCPGAQKWCSCVAHKLRVPLHICAVQRKMRA
jgi:hypothetical protein